jgi:hypothetical protein
MFIGWDRDSGFGVRDSGFGNRMGRKRPKIQNQNNRSSVDLIIFIPASANL